MPNITKKTPYTGKKLKAALMMSEGLKSQRDISEELDMHESTISKWKHDSDFAAFVDKMTLEHETASRAGLLRRAYAGAHLKQLKAGDDRSPHIDYLKFIADLQGIRGDKTTNLKDDKRIDRVQICTVEGGKELDDHKKYYPDDTIFIIDNIPRRKNPHPR